MGMIIQPSFAGGEVSPDVYSRVDIAKYNVALRTSLNGFIRAQGGWSNRTGTEFVTPTKYQNKKSRVIRFQFNTLQTYTLEFGDQYMRVIKDGGLVLEATKTITAITQANPGVVTSAAHGYVNGDWVYISGVGGMTQVNGMYFKVAGAAANTYQLQDVYGNNINTTAYSAYTAGGTSAKVYELATPYVEADLPLLDVAQSADTMTIVHRNYAPRDLTRTGHAAWSLSTITFAPLLSAPVISSVVATNQSALSTITGITQANPGRVTTGAAHGLTTGQRVYIQGVVGMTQVNNQFFTAVVTGSTDFDLQNTNTTAYSVYTSGGTVQRGSQSYRYVVTAVADETFEETLASASVAVVNDLTINGNYNTVNYGAIAGAQKYYVYREENASGVYGYIGSATGTTFVDQNIDADETDTPPGARNPFTGVGNYPASVTYHEQRKVFGYTDLKPQTVFATQAGNYKNLNVSNPARDDDAWTFGVASEEVNAIRYLVSQKDLLVFTSGAEFRFRPGQNGDTITPSSIAVNVESRYGSAHVRPIIIGKSILFAESSQSTDAQDKGYSVRDLGYTFTSDDYDGNDLTILSKHIFYFDLLTSWAYAKRPFGILWGVREDGYLAALTYLKEHEVWAWHRHNTDGYFESICCTPENGEDVPYFVVQRTINGNVRRYIERMRSRKFKNIEDAFFVDSGLTLDNWNQTATTFTLSGGVTWEAEESMTLTASSGVFAGTDVGREFRLRTYDRNGYITNEVPVICTGFTSATVVTVEPVRIVPAALRAVATTAWAVAYTTVSGLWHLEGKAIACLGDGNVLSDPENPIIVTNGAVTLPVSVAKAHIGLPYDSDFQTMAIAGDVSKGSLLGQTVNVGKVHIMVQETRGLRVGPNENELEELPQREFENWGEATRMKTGVVEAVCAPTWADGSFFARQSDPLPVTILAVIPDVEIGIR